MVRLKEDIVFQCPMRLLHFNSNLVRLKGAKDYEESYIETNFNSNLVRLKDLKVSFSPPFGTYFNSNLVRLKGSR